MAISSSAPLQPFSTRGTNTGQDLLNTRTELSSSPITRSNAPLSTVALVPITPILPFVVFSTAACAAGTTTPVFGISKPLKTSLATLDTVPQAAMMNLQLNEFKSSISCRAYSLIVLSLRVPYGTRPVSPKYTMSSPGNSSRSALTAVRPPIPESKTPIGKSLFISYPRALRRALSNDLTNRNI